MIQVPSDVVNLDDNCVVIQMRHHRRELIQRFMIQNFPDLTIAFSSEDIRRSPCKLKIETEKNKTTENLNIDFEKNSADVIRIDTKAVEKDEMMIETLSDFEFTVNQDNIEGSCRYITADRYEISLKVSKNSRPLVQENLPTGTVVIINQPLPDKETLKLKTILQLNRGDRILVGDVLKSLRDGQNKMDIKPAVSYETSGQNSFEKVFLSLQ